MAHQIESMLYVGATPWHKLGTRLDAPPTVADGIRAAGLDWTVRLDPLQTADGAAVDAFATRRDSDGKVLGVVGPQYRPLQNVDAFGFFDAFLAAPPLHTVPKQLIRRVGHTLDSERNGSCFRRSRRPNAVPPAKEAFLHEGRSFGQD